MDNRSLFIAAACHLFAERGYDAVGVQELAEAVGVTKPSLYHHFGSKEGLLTAIAETYLLPFNHKLATACLYRQDLTQNLRAITRLYFDFATQEARFFRLWMTLRFSPPQSRAYQALSPYFTQQQHLIAQLFTEAAGQHGNMRGRHNTYTYSFLGMIFSYAALALQGEFVLDDPLLQSAIQQFMYGIFS